jgi:hypothetical protein
MRESINLYSRSPGGPNSATSAAASWASVAAVHTKENDYIYGGASAAPAEVYSNSAQTIAASHQGKRVRANGNKIY